jgi:hypothetical protein
LKLLFWRIDAVIGSVHLITHRNKPENYFLGWLTIIMGGLLKLL